MQNDVTVGRVLLASLHQAIAEVVPDRLEFYERWLAPSAPGAPALDVESFMAMLAFLQQEGDGSDAVVRSAGAHAAVRCFRQLPILKRAYLRVLPRQIRAQKAVRLVVGLLPALYPESRVDVTRRGSTVFVNIDGSPFCAARAADPPSSDPPSCGFYAGAIATFLQLFQLTGSVKVSRCSASGSKSCLLMVLPGQPRSAGAAEGSLLGLAQEARPEPIVTGVAPVTASPEAAAPEAAPPETAPPEITPPEIAPVAPVLVRSDRATIEARWNAIAPPVPLSVADLPAMLKVEVDGGLAASAGTDRDPEGPWHRL